MKQVVLTQGQVAIAEQSAPPTLWKPAETAPKTRVILADIGYPWPLPCLWDAEVEKWAVAFLNVEAQNAENQSLNVWWETENEREIKAWAEMPALPARSGGK